MSLNPDQPPSSPAASAQARSFTFYYGWVNLAVAVVAMVGTLPGRTWGLGLITKPLLADMQLDHQAYASINLWATLFGAAFCLPIGRLIDRFGSRIMLTIVSLALGVTVVAMSRLPDDKLLFPLVLLTRGFGQSALSIISLALVGKWFYRRVGTAMTVWAVTMILGFSAAESLLGYGVRTFGWREAWSACGWLLIAGLAPLGWLFARSTPEQCGLQVDGGAEAADGGAEAAGGGAAEDDGLPSLSLAKTLQTPAFWVLAVALSLNSLTQSGIGLFGAFLVEQLNFEEGVFVQMMVIATFAALPGNLLSGWRAAKWSLRTLAALGMGLLAISLLVLPRIETWTGIILFSTVWGFACGVISVAMNAIWGRVFGRRYLGNIQGAVGVCHVLSSALGPKIMAASSDLTGDYGSFFVASAALCALSTAAVWYVPFPNLAAGAEPSTGASAAAVAAAE